MNGLAKIYYDVAHPAGFTGAANLKKHVRDKFDNKTVDTWLQSQNTYTLHKQRRLKFPRNRYKVYNIDDNWQADLIDMKSLKKDNDNINYILTVIDLFSRYAWVRIVKRKTAECIIEAFKDIFTSDGRKPLNLQTDKGREFTAGPVQKFFKENDINFYTTNNEIKAALVERFNRTLKNRMWKYFSYANSRRYLDVLGDLVSAYNNCYHSSIKMSPSSVNSKNVLHVWKTLNKIKDIRKIKENELCVNDTVRICRNKHIFEKGYETTFTEEIFKISKIIKRSPHVYQLTDLLGEKIGGVFYKSELQKVIMDDNTVFKIDKIAGERGKGNRREVLVVWKGYPEKFNTWVKASAIEKI